MAPYLEAIQEISEPREEVYEAVRRRLEILTQQEAITYSILLDAILTTEQTNLINKEAFALGHSKERLRLLGINPINPDPIRISLATYFILQNRGSLDEIH